MKRQYLTSTVSVDIQYYVYFDIVNSNAADVNFEMVHGQRIIDTISITEIDKKYMWSDCIELMHCRRYSISSRLKFSKTCWFKYIFF